MVIVVDESRNLNFEITGQNIEITRRLYPRAQLYQAEKHLKEFEPVFRQNRASVPAVTLTDGTPGPRTGSGENQISLQPRHKETSRISYGIKIGEVRIWSPTPAMIVVGVTASPPVI